VARNLIEGELSRAHSLPAAYPDWTWRSSSGWEEKFQVPQYMTFSFTSRGGWWQQFHVNWRELVLLAEGQSRGVEEQPDGYLWEQLHWGQRGSCLEKDWSRFGSRRSKRERRLRSGM